MEKTKNPFPNKDGWSYLAWEEGYLAEKNNNPYLPENEQLGEFWQDGYEAKIYDNRMLKVRALGSKLKKSVLWLGFKRNR